MLGRKGGQMSGSFVQELKRRNVFRVALIYIVVSWLLMQIGDVMFPALLLPDWTTRMLVAFLLLGLPIALIFAWAYEITPEGIKKTVDVTPDESITSRTGRRIDFLIIGVLAVAVVVLGLKVWTDDAAPPIELAADSEKSIAVLPFKNQSASAENAEFFASGVHDELLTLLSKLGRLKVISRTSVERLDPRLSIPEIGELLGVATVLEGQVQRAGDRLRINVQLIKVAGDDHLWANTYDRELTAQNIFDVQSDIARTIADSLHAELSATDESVLSTAPTNSLAALEHYMLGLQLAARATFESFPQAIEHFNDATVLDPVYAEAWVAIAQTHSRMWQTGLIDLQEYVAAAEPAIAEALKNDSNLPAAHAALGALRWPTGDLDAAEDAFKTALQLNPDDPKSLADYGSYLRFNGRAVDAIPVLEKALVGDPLNVDTRFVLGKAEMYAGHPEKTLIQAEKILEIDPSSVFGYTAMLQAYLDLGRIDLMWPWFIKAMDADPADYEIWAGASIDLLTVGASEWSDAYTERALDLGAGEPTVLGSLAYKYALRGQLDEALAVAREALAANLDDRWNSKTMFLRLLRDDALRTGNYDEALSAYREHRPTLFKNPPEIAVTNIYTAADLALLLGRSGKPDDAKALIDAAVDWYKHSGFDGIHGSLTTIGDVQLFAVNGDEQRAMRTLREAVDAGWVTDWRWQLENKNLDSIREEPEFQEIVAELEIKMATQLAAIKALPDMGELDLRYK